MPNSLERIFTPEEVADRLSVTPKTIKDWLRSGNLRGIKAGRLWRIRESDLEDFLRRKELKDIGKIRAADEANFKTAILIIGDSATLLQDLVNLYNMLAEMIKKYGPVHDEIIAGMQFLLACRYQLNLSALSALRGHLTDSFFFVRKAIEFCAFAQRIKEVPELGMVWLNAGDEEKSYKIYRAQFSQKKIFPENNRKLRMLYERYDHCSKLIHPSLFALARHIKIIRTEDELNIKFRAVELSESDPSEPIRTLLWIIDTNFIILKVFEEIFGDIIASEQKRWEVWINGLEAKIAVHKEKWKPIILDRERLKSKDG